MLINYYLTTKALTLVYSLTITLFTLGLSGITVTDL